MNTPFRSCSKPARFLGIALSLMTGLAVYGALVTPVANAAQANIGVAGYAATASVSPNLAVAVLTAASVSPSAVTAQVPVAQQPLILQPPIPPDIVLMLDDSGSMEWDVMPDYGYLSDTSQQGLTDIAVNGVYYDPTVTYTLPPQVNGTLYPDADFDAAPVNGFDPTGDTVDLSTYRGRYDSVDPTYEASPVQDSIAVAKTGASPYSAASSCPSGGHTSGVYLGYCYFTSAPSIPFNFFDISNHDFYVSRCNSISDVYDHATDTCTPGISFFTYTTGSGGSYVSHYVAKNAGDCAAAGLSSSVCDESAATRQNVANWFAYYHTRILMAKSGLMTVFSQMDPGFRFGFGSINNNNASYITSKLSYTYKEGKYIADVAVFGDGSSGTQRANFWSWVTGESGNDNTPLRSALAAVGEYYQTSQPWTTMLTDPTYGTPYASSNIACRQAYTILTTDGFWNEDFSSSAIAGASSNQGPAITGPNAQHYQYSPTQPFSGGATSDGTPSLADVAMYYWENDLQGGTNGIANEVPPSPEDPAFWQHMVTFTMGIGFTPGGITGTAPNGNNPPTTTDIFNWSQSGGGAGSQYAISGFDWPTPSINGSIYNIADLEHAGVDGHGGFFSATNPQAFVSGIENALKRATERVGTGASLAANSTQLTTGTVIYQADYYTAKWKGDLKAFAVNAVTGAITATPTWQASHEMPAASMRTIQTYNPDTGTFPGFTAANLTQLSSAERSALGSNTATQTNMVNYLRGDPSQEQQNGGTLRSRDWVLGDVVDSQPVYSGPPDPNEFINQTFYGTTVDTSTNSVPFYDWAVGTTDSSGTFTASKASTRTPYIFVAANDGMLHALNAQTGVETFAYLPGAVVTAGLANLSNPAYGSAADPHQFYNDGQLTIADAYLPSLSQINGSSWHTILVGTTGRGLAEAVYALDVTDPANIKPLWERSANDGLSGSNYIGQMVGKPVITQTNYTPASKSSSASSTWSVLIGNGYNSAAGQAALLQFNLATGALSVHTTDSSTSNGLAAPVAWMDNPANGVSDMAYAGDLLGRVWSFQLNDTTGSNATASSTGTKLFTAKDASGNVQPITAGMLAGENSQTSDVWLFFGTGEYLSSTDLINTDTQTWYGIIVQSSTKHIVSNLSNGRSALVQRTITAQTSGGSGSLPARTVSTQVVNSNGTTDMSGKSGWYMDLLAPIGSSGAPVQQGERMVDPNEFQGSLLIGVTRIPQVTDVCNPSGSGWIMAIDPFTGAAPSSDFFDVNNDGYINGGDWVNGGHAAGVGFGSLPNAPIFVGGIMETSFDNGTAASLKTAGTVGVSQRVSWRELMNP